MVDMGDDGKIADFGQFGGHGAGAYSRAAFAGLGSGRHGKKPRET
jgi:hypothetical protein